MKLITNYTHKQLLINLRDQEEKLEKKINSLLEKGNKSKKIDSLDTELVEVKMLIEMVATACDRD